MTCRYCQSDTCGEKCLAACKNKFTDMTKTFIREGLHTGGVIHFTAQDTRQLYANNVYTYLKQQLEQGAQFVIENNGQQRRVTLEEMQQD